MKRRTALVMSAILVIACLGLVAMQAGSPLLYSPRSDEGGRDHTNPAALDRVTGDRAAQVLPLISDLLNEPGSLVLNIRAGDFEYSARELEEYRQISRNLDNLVINLDMTESEVAEFRSANKENLQILTDLFNGTARWEELQTLEIRYRESGDSQMLTTVTYEGEALRRQIQDLYRDYLEQEEVMIGTADTFGLNSSGYIQSERDFRDIVYSVEQNQEERMAAVLPGDAGSGQISPLTLDIGRTSASYYDMVGMTGRLGARKEEVPIEVDLFIDARKAGTFPVNPDGSFSYDHLVEHDREGTHTVFAVFSGSVFSNIRMFTVVTESTALILEPPSFAGDSTVCRGQLLAGDVPVRAAPVEIHSDGRRIATALTGPDGSFSSTVKISPGKHRVKSVFSGDDFPLSPAESAMHEVFVPEPSLKTGNDAGFFAHPLHAGILAVSVFASCIAAFLYLRGRKPRSPDTSPVFHLPKESTGDIHESPLFDAAPSVAESEVAGESTVPDTYRPDDPYHFFSTLRFHVSRRMAFLHPLSLTPRELCAMCRGLSVGAAVCRFTRAYERARYGGPAFSENDREPLVQSYTSAMEGLEGMDH